MPFSSVSSGGGLTKLFDSTLGASALSIDSGAGGFSTSFDLLQIYVIARTDEVAALSTIIMSFNNDGAAHYDFTLARNRNTTLAGVSGAANAGFQIVCPGSSAIAGFAGICQVNIPGYAQTTFNKVCTFQNATVTSAVANDDVGIWAQVWENTAAVNRVKISVSGGANLVAGSRLLIYGT